MKTMQRRDFVRKGSRLAIASGIMALPAAVSGAHGPMDPMFVHHVFFWLKNPSDPGQIKRFEQELKKLVTIEAIYQHHLGLPADTRREVIDSSYHYSMLTLFRTRADHDAYQVHPVHDAFRTIAGEFCSKILVYDSIDMG